MGELCLRVCDVCGAKETVTIANASGWRNIVVEDRDPKKVQIQRATWLARGFYETLEKDLCPECYRGVGQILGDKT